MWGLLWNLASELVGVFFKPFGTDGHLSFKLISDECDFLDVPCKPLGLNVCPFLFLRIRTSLLEKHPGDSEQEDEINPRNTERNPYRFLFLIFCHILSDLVFV